MELSAPSHHPRLLQQLPAELQLLGLGQASPKCSLSLGSGLESPRFWLLWSGQELEELSPPPAPAGDTWGISECRVRNLSSSHILALSQTSSVPLREDLPEGLKH